MDLSTHTRRWTKSIVPDDATIIFGVTALALNEHASKVALHGTIYMASYGSPHSYIYVLNTADGGYNAELFKIQSIDQS